MKLHTHNSELLAIDASEFGVTSTSYDVTVMCEAYLYQSVFRTLLLYHVSDICF